MHPSRRIRLHKGPRACQFGEMCIFKILRTNVKIPTSLVTRGIFKDCIEAKNNAERRPSLPLDSTFCAVFKILLKNFLKLTKWLIGIILPLFETYIQFTM